MEVVMLVWLVWLYGPVKRFVDAHVRIATELEELRKLAERGRK